jgi:hypothetical protein
MRPAVLLTIVACLAATGCSTISQTPSTDVWLCAYQLGDRYRDEAVKPDVTGYDLTVTAPVRWIQLNYSLPIEGQAPEKHSMICEAAPWGFGVTANDGFKYEQPEPDTYPGTAAETPSAQGRTADTVRDAVRATGLHVNIPGVPSF